MHAMESSKLFYHHLIIYTMLFPLHVLHAAPTNISPTKQGASLKLIDPLSPISPFYNPNLTDTERFNRIMLSDRRRISYLISIDNPDFNKLIHPTEIRPVFLSHDLSYMVEMGIGAGAGYEVYYLHFDTASGLSWIQCEPCGQCFRQQPRLFNPQNSPTYGVLTFTNPFCRGADYKLGPNGRCDFSMFYADRTSAKGTVSSETFTFPASQGGSIQVPNVAFGCVHQTDTDYPFGGPVGIMGMNLDHESFMVQASCAPVTGKRFSYCLVEPGSDTPMTLRFGNDITWPPVAKIQETRILRYDYGFAQYYLNLTGMSIDNTGIYFAPGTFERAPGGPGGFIIDSGAHYSYLPRLAYQIVAHALVLHFETLHVIQEPGRGGLDQAFPLCFNLPENADPANLLPSITYHFDGGADLRLFYQQVFHVDMEQRQFCLTILPEETDTAKGVLGAYQQVNTQFEFDMRLGAFLRFATVDCAHGV